MPHPYLEIPELVNLASGRGLVRIPVEQDVPFTPRVSALVDTAEFQRLRHITQLGLAPAVYPGATHTRFEHALGVFNTAVHYLWQLGKDERFAASVDRHTAETLLAAALLHDLGHWPFCHPIEDMALPDLPPHEQFAADFLSPEGELAEVLATKWQVEPAEVLAVLTPRISPAPPHAAEEPPSQLPAGSRSSAAWPGDPDNAPVSLRLVRSMLSGPVDIDKMDYLHRDSQHAGVPYGRHFDRSRLINSLIVNAAGDGLAITEKGRTAAELMVFARYVMFSEVYWHHAVRAATSMFARAFYELRSRLDLRSLFRLTESEMIAELRSHAAGTECEQLVEGIFGPKRVLYKRVAEYSHYQSPQVYDRLARRPYGFLVRCASYLAEHLTRSLRNPVEPNDLLIDAPPPHREIEFQVDIFFPKEGVFRTLAEVSPVVEALAKTQFDDYVKRVRVFVHPQRLSLLGNTRNFATCLDGAIRDTENAESARS